MAVFTARITLVFEVLQADQFTVNGRTVTYIPATMKVTGADRRQGQVWTLSAGLSAQALPLAPLGVSAPGKLLFFLADQPVDLRWNTVSDVAFVSAVRMLALGAQVSTFLVTTGSHATTILLEVVGGSNATVTANLPIP